MTDSPPAIRREIESAEVQIVSFDEQLREKLKEIDDDEVRIEMMQDEISKARRRIRKANTVVDKMRQRRSVMLRTVQELREIDAP